MVTDGILLIDKPQGFTSFDVVARVRNLLGVRKIGHSGTLDPFATGLLVLSIGKATKIVRYMDPYDKEYRVQISFGKTTDTLDLTGQTTGDYQLSAGEKQELRASDFSRLRQAVAGLTDLKSQQPPLYSAVKIGGKRLYQYARAGEEVERPERQIRVYKAKVETITLNDTLVCQLFIHCSKGTYIRSLAASLGETLGWGAHASKLERLSSGPYRLSDAISLPALEEVIENTPSGLDKMSYLASRGLLMPLSSALQDFDNIVLCRKDAVRLIQGQPVFSDLKKEELSDKVAFFYADRLIAVGRLEHDSRIKTERVLVSLADI